MSKHEQTGRSSYPLFAAILTVILVIGAMTAIVLDVLATARGRAIEDVPQPPLVLPLVCAGLLVIAAAWLYWLVRTYGVRHIVTIVVAGATALLLVATPLFAWQSVTSERDLTVISLTCDAELLRNSGGASLAQCEEEAVDTIVLLEAMNGDDQWVPDASSDNLTRTFEGLPGGPWETMLTVDGPADTVAVSAIGERGDEQVRLGSFRPYMDSESGRIRWSGRVGLEADVSTVRVLFYLSANPAVESARIRFEVRECSGQNLRTFDASQCEPMDASAPFVIEKSPEGPRTWRHPQVSRQGSDLVITNLEAREYELQPDYASIEIYTQSTDVLIIPSAMPQIAENSISVPGESAFQIPIESNTGELVYTIYVFPSGPVVV